MKLDLQFRPKLIETLRKYTGRDFSADLVAGLTMGFTSGIAVLIFSTQIKDFFGLQVEKVPSEFIQKMTVLCGHLGSMQWRTFLLAAGSFAIIRLWPAKWRRVMPGSIAALLIGTTVAAVLQVPVETIGSKFGGIPQGLPGLHLPNFEWENVRHLFQ